METMMPNNDERFLGSWKLVSFEAEIQGSPERVKPWGETPNGYVMIGADGRMIALLTARNRIAGETETAIANLFRSMVCYAGSYRLSGDRFITKVDTSWNEEWNGTEQERIFRLHDGLLELTTKWTKLPFAPESSMARGILKWQRIGDVQ